MGLDKSIPNLLAKKGSISYIFHKIQSFISEESADMYINNENLETLKNSVKEELNHISILQDISINHDVDDVASMLASMLFLVDKSSKHIDYSGEGLKRRLHIILYILSGIASHNDNYGQHIEDLKNTPNSLSVVVAIDEPELHLHPHWQRQLINEILLLTESPVIEELKISFQIIIVTHSPYMIQGSGYAINRLFLSNQQSCCIAINIPTQSCDIKEIHDRYINQFREAYFAKGVLLVEGETDQGVLNSYNTEKEFLLDKHSISIINMMGAENTRKVYQWFKNLKIPAIAIVDRDKENANWCTQLLTDEPESIIISSGIDIEESIYDAITQHENKNVIFNRLLSDKIISNLKYPFQMSKDYQKACKIVYGTDVDMAQKEHEFKNASLDDIFTGTEVDNDFHKVLWLSKLWGIKSMYEGSLVGRILCENNIFPQYLVVGLGNLIQKIEEQ